MNKVQTKIHDILKEKYEKITGKTMECQRTFSPTRNKYYFANLNDNFYTPMSEKVQEQFGGGSGKELKDKMFALRSSAAMTYNIFGNDDVTILPNDFITSGKYSVSYERQFNTLNNSNSPANLDVVLESDEEIVFIEVKLFEPFYHKINYEKELSGAYEEDFRYVYSDSFYFFQRAIEKIQTSAIKRYDAWQMFKHSLGIYNYARTNELKKKKLTLLNCVWTFNDEISDSNIQFEINKIMKEEQAEFKIFKDSMFYVQNAFEKQNLNFTMDFVTVKDLISIIDIDETKKNWLGRYL